MSRPKSPHGQRSSPVARSRVPQSPIQVRGQPGSRRSTSPATATRSVELLHSPSRPPQPRPAAANNGRARTVSFRGCTVHCVLAAHASHAGCPCCDMCSQFVIPWLRAVAHSHLNNDKPFGLNCACQLPCVWCDCVGAGLRGYGMQAIRNGVSSTAQADGGGSAVRAASGTRCCWRAHLPARVRRRCHRPAQGVITPAF